MLRNEMGMIIISQQDQMDFDLMYNPVNETKTWYPERTNEKKAKELHS